MEHEPTSPRKRYTAPQVTDYGTLVDVTAACIGGNGGDAYSHTLGSLGGVPFGVSNPAFGCTSN